MDELIFRFGFRSLFAVFLGFMFHFEFSVVFVFRFGLIFVLNCLMMVEGEFGGEMKF